MITRILGTALAAAMTILSLAAPSQAIDYDPLIGEVGAYAVWGDDNLAAANGISYHVSSWNPAYADQGSKILVSNIQSKMYHTFCTGYGQCEITPEREQVVLDFARTFVQQHHDNPGIVGWYLVDDRWGDFSSVLPKIHDIIRTYDTGTDKYPTVCGLQLDLASSIEPNPLRHFRNQVTDNYSPSWCNAFTIYSYAQDGATGVDWDMSETLPGALDFLAVEKGWRDRNGTFLGTPQAFGGGGFVVPTRGELRIQAEAFCAAGSYGLLPYAWNDNYLPDRVSLGNMSDGELGEASFRLRRGMRDAHQTCFGSDM